MRHTWSVILIAAVSSCGYEPQATPPPPYDARVHQPAEAELGAQYTIAYLPTLGGSRNRPTGIASNGLVAGFVNRAGERQVVS